MAKQCCNCNKKLSFFNSGFDVGSRKQYFLCERCHIEKLNVHAAKSEGDLEERLKYFSRILDGEVVSSDVKDEFYLIAQETIHRIKKQQVIVEDAKEKEQKILDEIQKAGYHFTTEMRTLMESYKSDVSVSKGKVVVKREGKTSLPAESTIYFKDTTAVSWGSSVGRAWISFTVPGATSLGRSAVVTSNTIAIGISGPNIPYEDSFSIVFGLNQEVEAEKHFRIIKRLFDNYKENSHTESISDISNQQESAIDKLKKLKDLRELGILSESEYEAKRVKLLSEI